ncbi:MAG: molybdopterin-dependent oxidoreductase, partial [Rubrivivax sp.]
VAPDQTKVLAGLRREDLFTLVLEQFMTDTAAHADVVLPATTQLEHLDLHTSYGHTYAMVNEPAIAPLGQARPNTQIFRDLARHMGFDDACLRDDDEALARVAFRPEAVAYGVLRNAGWVKLKLPEAPFAEGGFPTPSGRCLIDAPGLGIPDYVPNYESRASAPELAQRYPLAMISPPARNFLNSTFVNVRSLRDIEAEPILEIHPDDAAPRGIETPQMVRVFNDRGSYLCKAVPSLRARPGVVNGLGVWWRKLGADGSNVNELTHQRLTDIGRAPTFYDCLVDVRRADAKAP